VVPDAGGPSGGGPFDCTPTLQVDCGHRVGEVEQRKSRTTASNNLNTLTGPQLTMHGIGFSVSNGEHHNPFYHGGYLDYRQFTS
jgi:hypothetical protein